jgi:hypothetical protein
MWIEVKGGRAWLEFKSWDSSPSLTQAYLESCRLKQHQKEFANSTPPRSTRRERKAKGSGLSRLLLGPMSPWSVCVKHFKEGDPLTPHTQLLMCQSRGAVVTGQGLDIFLHFEAPLTLILPEVGKSTLISVFSITNNLELRNAMYVVFFIFFLIY